MDPEWVQWDPKIKWGPWGSIWELEFWTLHGARLGLAAISMPCLCNAMSMDRTEHYFNLGIATMDLESLPDGRINLAPAPREQCEDKGPDFANFWDFGISINFYIFGTKMGRGLGAGRASIGSREGFRCMWTKFQPKWVPS